MEEMKPDTEVKEETSVPEEGAAEATTEKPAKKPHGFVQFIWFIVMSLIAFALQMIIAQFGDDLLALCGVANEGEFIKVGLDSLTLAGFIAYLVANIVAKVISYILNRKKTFAAVNNLAFSFSVYVIMCVALIVAETFIAAPIQNFWIGIGVPESWAGMVTVITYSIPDFLIVFLMEKFVIMNNKLFAKKKEEVAAADETAVAVDDTAAVEAPVVADEAIAEEAPAAAVEEAPVEQAAEETAVEEAQSEEAVEEVAEAVEEATPVEEVVTEEPLAETPQEEQAIAEAEAAEEQTPSDEAPAAIEEAPVEEVAPAEEAAAEEPVAEEAQETVAEEAPVEEAAPVEETAPAEEPVAEAAPEAVVEEEVAAAAPVEEKPAKKAPAKKPAAKKAADKKPAAKKSDAKKPAAKKAAPKKEEPKKEELKKEEAKEAAPSNVTVLFEAPDTDSPKGKFVVIKDDLNPDRPYKFQLKANNGQVLYESESFKIKPRAKQIEVFRNTINNGTSTIDSEKNGTFRYKLFKADGSLYGVGEGYKTRASAESALESVKNFCNTSNVLEDTTVEEKK